MRILHLEASPGWGGQEIRILREAEGMRLRGHEVVLAIMTGGRLAEEARKKGFPVYEISFLKRCWIAAFLRLIRIMKRHRIEIVNTHSSLDSWIGGIAARALGLHIVRTRHLSTPVRSGLNSRLLYGYLADYVVTTCSAIIPDLSLQSRKPLAKMRCVATGVEPDAMERPPAAIEEARKRLNASPQDILVGTACFMRSWKGIDDFLGAANLLRDLPHLRWVIIGGGHEAAYRKRAKDLGLDGIVHFTGHLEDPIPAIGSLDLFLLLSTAHEGISQALLQAAYLGKPLIATATGGLREVCLDGKTGVQVPIRSPERVAKAVLALANDAAKREALGRAARRLVDEQFTFRHTLDHMEEVYREQ